MSDKLKFIDIGDCLINVINAEEALDDDGKIIKIKIINKSDDQQKMLMNVWQEVFLYRYYTAFLPEGSKIPDSEVKNNQQKAQLFSTNIMKQISGNLQKISELYTDTIQSGFEFGESLKGEKILEYIFKIEGLDKWISKELQK